MKHMWVLGVVGALSAAACAPGDDIGNEDDDLKTSIGADSPAAYGIVHYLNQSGHYQTLVGPVGLAPKAAEAIAKHIFGLEWNAGMKVAVSKDHPTPQSDDDPLDDFAELTKIPGVTSSALLKLRDYVKAHVGLPQHVVDWVALTDVEAKAMLDFVNGASSHAIRFDAALGPYATAAIVGARPFTKVEQLHDLADVTAKSVTKLRDFTAVAAAPDFVASGPAKPADFWQLKVTQLPVSAVVTQAAGAAGDGNYFIVPARYHADPAALKAALAQQDAHDHLAGDLLFQPLGQDWAGHATASATPVSQATAFDKLVAAMFGGWNQDEIGDRPDHIRPLVASLFKGASPNAVVLLLHWDNADDTNMEGIAVVDPASGEMRVLAVDFPA